jgi:hypothetical protein
MRIKWKNIIFLIVFAFLSLWVYPLILGYWTALNIPLLSSLPKNKIIILTGRSIGSAIGVVICAFVLAFPMGYLTKQQPKILGAALGVISTIAYFFLYPTPLQEFDWFVGTIAILEHAAFVAGCIVFTVMGCRVATRRLGNG